MLRSLVKLIWVSTPLVSGRESVRFAPPAQYQEVTSLLVPPFSRCLVERRVLNVPVEM